MLRHLAIRDMLLIPQQELDFGSGLNVLTGETGAGKSILLDCLGFVLGWRGRADLTRQGAEQGEVLAEFLLPEGHPAHEILAEAGLPPVEDDTLYLRRIVTADGRKTGFVNDRRSSAEVLRALSAVLVEVHGQHDDRGLLDPKGHLTLLDVFANIDLTDLRAAWAQRRNAAKAVENAEIRLAEIRAEEEFLRHAVEELGKLAPQAGEEAALDAARRRMQAASRVGEDVARAAHALGDNGAETVLVDAVRWLEGAADAAEGRLDAPLNALSRAIIELGEASVGVNAALDAMRFDPLELDRAEERLFAIRALARKYEVHPDHLDALAADFRQRLGAITTGAADLAALHDAQEQADVAYQKKASEISALRMAAAKRLDKAMGAELVPLKMERAVFETKISETDAGPNGMDAVSFTVATNPGAPSGPLEKIASGGELSRFLLALKVCLARGTSTLSMIFDEIDRGVGGATADAVGRRLAMLAENAQVLVVTHSPQVAARGSAHFLVAKAVRNGSTISAVTALSPDERIEEIARMLAGETITPEARAAASTLMRG